MLTYLNANIINDNLQVVPPYETEFCSAVPEDEILL